MTINRKDQRFIRRTCELRGRYHATNGPPALNVKAPRQATGSNRHMWACPGCGMEVGPEFMSCRSCETLKWGVCP